MADPKPDVSSDASQIRASVLHGAKDLRIVCFHTPELTYPH
jgi:hypothetical protein